MELNHRTPRWCPEHCLLMLWKLELVPEPKASKLPRMIDPLLPCSLVPVPRFCETKEGWGALIWCTTRDDICWRVAQTWGLKECAFS